MDPWSCASTIDLELTDALEVGPVQEDEAWKLEQWKHHMHTRPASFVADTVAITVAYPTPTGPTIQTNMSASPLPPIANIPESSSTVDVRVIDTYGN